MRKVTSIATAATYYLAVASQAFAAPAEPTVKIEPPPGAVGGNITIDNLVAFIINLLFAAGIIAALVFLIYGGIKWVISGGDKAKVEAARNHIVAAIVGLVVMAAAFVIMSVVFSVLGVTWDPIKNSICIPTLTRTCKP